MAELVSRYWKLAVITVEEDARLNRVARSTVYDNPDERWKAAGIEFEREGQECGASLKGGS
ncbi:MAG: hypothetical protein AB1942_12555 [Pseudomonadota bacterium]